MDSSDCTDPNKISTHFFQLQIKNKSRGTLLQSLSVGYAVELYGCTRDGLELILGKNFNGKGC